MNSNHQSESVVEVLLPVGAAGGFDYRVASGSVSPGDYVRVPFGRKELVGVVWGQGKGNFAYDKLKTVSGRLDLPPLLPAIREWIDWVAWYTVTPPGMVLKMLLASDDALQPAAAKTGYILNTTHKADKLTAARKQVIAALSDGVARSASAIKDEAQVSDAVVREMIKVGWLKPVPLTVSMQSITPQVPRPIPADLSDAQRIAADDLCGKAQRQFSVTLLDGVTGSGKTEVYFEMMEAVLKQKGQVLVLLPEIALTMQWLRRCEARFGIKPHLWHSSVTPARRRDTWQAIVKGEAQIIVGARSALFLPYSNLSLIVVDEEHEPSYKQEDGVLYHARDMAIARAKMEKLPIVLVSATPSLETWHNVESKRYGEVHLPERFFVSRFPDVSLVDMRGQELKATEFISPPLRQALVETLERGEQGLLFLNRRGYAPLLLCRACGHRFQCPQCTAWLITHQRRRQLICHHCDYQAPLPSQCPSCQASDQLHPCGPGVERIAEEAAKLFPNARLAVLTSDTMDSPKEAESLIQKITNREMDILVGTQIIAKGHHFPGLQFVGVIDADIGLAGGDPRAAERTYQLLHQLAGRAGRESESGRVMIQTYLPEHPVMKALCAGDREKFMALETRYREEAGMPPFGRLIGIILEAREDTKLISAANLLASYAPSVKDVQILGPAPAPLSMLRGWHRMRFLVKGPKQADLQSVVREWVARAPIPSSIKVKIDVDPISFL